MFTVFGESVRYCCLMMNQSPDSGVVFILNPVEICLQVFEFVVEFWIWWEMFFFFSSGSWWEMFFFMPRKMGGRGLTSVKDCYWETILDFDDYAHTDVNGCLKLVSERCDYHHSPLNKLFRKAADIRVAISPSFEVKEKQDKLRDSDHKLKIEQGEFDRMCEQETISKKSLQWHNKVHLPAALEMKIFKTRQQICKCRARLKRMNKTKDDTCRYCHAARETTAHLIGGCPALRTNKYIYRHDTLCRFIHHSIAKRRGFKVEKEWWKHKPQAIMTIGQGKSEEKLFWNQLWNTTAKTSARKPDIVWIRHDKILLLEISCPLDRNVIIRYDEKMSKYDELVRELKARYKRPVYTKPIVIGATGMLPLAVDAILDDLEISAWQCQKLVAIETVRLLDTLSLV